MEPHFDFTPLLIVSLLAVAVPVALHRIPRLRVPIVVGEIVAGIVVGPSVLGLIGPETDAWLEFLKLFGFAYLMFLSGLEIDFTVLKRVRRIQKGSAASRLVGGPLRAGIFAFVVTVSAALLCAQLLVDWGLASDPVVMALVLSTTSLGIVAPVLQERGLMRSLLGQYTLVASVVSDFCTVTIVSIYVILQTRGITFEVMFVLVLLAFTFLVYRLAGLSSRYPALRRLVDELSHATAQLDTRGALALAVVFIALAQGLGVEVILGAFMAGAIVSLVTADEGSALRPKLHALGYGFFIPIFFVMVGVDFDLQALLKAPQGLFLVPVVLLMAYAVKYAAALVYRPFFSWRETFAIGTLTSSRLSLIVAVSAIGVELGAITQTTNAAIVLVAIFTVVVSPIVFNRVMEEPPERMRTRVLIAGSTPHARLLAQRLQSHGDEVTVLTANRHLREEIEAIGVHVEMASPGRQADSLVEAGIEKARALVLMMDDEDEALRLGRLAKDRYDTPSIVAHCKTVQSADAFRNEGIQAVVPSVSTVVLMEMLVRHPAAFALVAETDVARNMVEVQLQSDRLVGRPLRKVPLPGDALVLMIVRDGEVVFPRGNTRLRSGDRITLVGSAGDVDLAAQQLVS